MLTSASTATSYVGMIVNNVAKLCNVAAKALVLCTLSDSDTVLLFVPASTYISRPTFDFYTVKEFF